MQFQKINLNKILFLDIETVPMASSFDELPEHFQELWIKKAQFLIQEDETPESIFNRAGIYAEFGKIVCISVGFINEKANKRELRLKSFAGDDEKQLLSNFKELITSHFDMPTHLLCAHNGKEFDFPYIARRMLINGITVPDILDLRGKRPWEVQHLDTMELWKFGDYKHYTSLNLLAAVFEIPSPKNDIDGSQVADVYYQHKDLNRIVEYCEKDVETLINIFLRYRGDDIFK
ncbi:MAG TPA: 3'-5' exonuclease [Bacteroidales bacterium]|nr:3'-5' exonuclease [Bacteroidales bacterium]